MSDSEISRRSFLGMGAAAAVLAGAGLAGCSGNAASGSTDSGGSADEIAWTKETDVVVVGLGGAGCAAAIEANKEGAEVVVLEMTKDGGGSTSVCGGFIFMGGGTELQKKFGYDETVDQYFDYLASAAGDNANTDFIKIICDSGADLYSWCVECGMDFDSGEVDPEHHLGGYNAGFSLGFSGNEMARQYASVTPPIPHGHMPQPGSSGADIFEPLKATVEGAGIEVLYETPGTQLFIDDSGRVIGISAQGPDGEVLIKAKKGVVLTCGGFTNNDDMVNDFYPYPTLLGVGRVAGGTENGSGILMGLAAGAATRGMGNFQVGRTIVTKNELLANGVLVDAVGHRIVAEDEYNSFIGKAIVQAPTAQCYLIVDDETWNETNVDGKDEPMVSADSIAEIAAALYVDADILTNTFDFYNASVALGNDREFGKDPKFLKDMSAGPFHVIYAGTETMYTGSLGGLKIDTDARVLDLEGNAIPGLYSAGRNSGSIYGWYMGSGSSMADCLTFGRIAGKNVAAE